MKSVRVTEFFKELDASNCIGRGVDGEEVVQGSNAGDVPKAVLLQVQVLLVLVLRQLVAQVLHGRVGFLHRQSCKGIGAAIYKSKIKEMSKL